MSAVSIPDLIEALGSVGTPSSIEHVQRKELLEAIRAAQTRVETPLESIMRLGWLESSWMAALRIGDQAGWFKAMSDAKGKPVHVDQIASSSNGDVDFTLRYLKHLAAMGTLEQTSKMEFKNAALGEALAKPPLDSFGLALTDLFFSVYLKLPETFKSEGYKTPKVVTEAPAVKVLTGGQPLFTWLGAAENRHLAEATMNMLSCNALARLPWTRTYPMHELLSGADDGVLLVDIGGNRGEELQPVLAAVPALAHANPARLILQDQAHVIKDVTSSQGVEAQVHDFFTEQPVKGARAYHLRNILHDWTDDDCMRILINLKPAMKAGYSKILINETVVPDIGATPTHTAADIGMMSYHAGRERSESDWRVLFEKVQLRIVKIWQLRGESESVIEVDLA